jgi:hypothetical protein
LFVGRYYSSPRCVHAPRSGIFGNPGRKSE